MDDPYIDNATKRGNQMTATINPSSIGNAAKFAQAHASQAQRVASSEMFHFYVVTANGYTMGFARGQYSSFDQIQHMIWMDEQHADQVVAEMKARVHQPLYN